MKKIYNIFFTIIAVSTVSACIPPGIGGKKSSSADAPNLSTDAPTLRADTDINRPDWDGSSIDKNVRNVQAGEYIVQSGDTLSGIAARSGAPQSEIAKANDLSPPYAIQIGQKLQIPAGTYHRVSSGETGIAIARAYGVPWRDIVELNGLEAPYILRVGQRLKLPQDGEIKTVDSQTVTPEERASAFNIEIDDIVTGGEPAVAAKEDTPDATLTSNIPRPDAFDSQFIYPLRGRIISRFGSKGGGIVNDGINIASDDGAPIGAAADGVVVYSGDEIEVFGGLILVDHGAGWVTAYGHVGQINVKRGQKVKAGQNIGQVGQTGYVDRPQLHFEIRKDRKPVDPLTKLPNN